MVGVSEAIAAYNGLKTAFDIVQGINAAAKEAAMNEVKVNLTRHILEAQQALTAASFAQSEAAERIRQLEQEIVRMKDWTAQQERYELVNIWHGAVAYAEKAGVKGRQAPHWLCANCFDQGHKSYMQHQGAAGPNGLYKCASCNGSITVDRRSRPT